MKKPRLYFCFFFYQSNVMKSKRGETKASVLMVMAMLTTMRDLHVFQLNQAEHISTDKLKRQL